MRSRLKAQASAGAPMAATPPARLSKRESSPGRGSGRITRPGSAPGNPMGGQRASKR